MSYNFNQKKEEIITSIDQLATAEYDNLKQKIEEYKTKSMNNVDIFESNIKKNKTEIDKIEEDMNKKMNNINNDSDNTRELIDETLKMKKQIENVDKQKIKKKNMIYILFGINIIFALFIVLSLYYKINQNTNISKTFITKIKN